MSHIFSSIQIGIFTAFVEMNRHKLRSFLSILGVMLGVAALVAMLLLIGGLNVFLEEKIGKWISMVYIWKKWNPSEEEKLSWSKSPGLRFDDGTFLQDSSEAVSTVYQQIERRQNVAIGGEAQRHATIRGVSWPTMEEDNKNITADVGRLLTREEIEGEDKVCMISWEIYDRLKKRMRQKGLDSTDVLLQQVRLGDIELAIVGTFKPIDPDFQPWRMRRSLIIPLGTMKKYITGTNPDPGSIALTVAEPKEREAQSLLISRLLTSRHRGVTDFEYRGADWAEDMGKMMQNITVIMGIISVVSLLVGGLGIMNVMLSSISERIKEIGIRKALGAQNLQIFIQFVAETTTLSVTGGVLGALIGMAPLLFGESIKKSTQGAIMPTILPEHLVFIFLIIVSVGIVFGLYPAVKASRMDPIDALRYE